MGISKHTKPQRTGSKPSIIKPKKDYVKLDVLPRGAVIRRKRQDEQTVDVLAAPALEVYFAKITGCEFEHTGPRARGQSGQTATFGTRASLTMDCYRARWLQLIGALEDLSTMPAIEALATEQENFLVIEAIVDPSLYVELASRSRTQLPHLHKGNWIQLSLLADLGTDIGMPCTAWLPAQGSTDPMSIGQAGRTRAMRAYAVKRITPFSLRRSLMKFGEDYERIDSDPVAGV